MKNTEPENAASSIRVALKASNGKYVSAVNSGSSPLQATQSKIGSWETFEMLHQGDRRVALKAANGRFVCNEGDGQQPLIANRDQIGAWETFEVVPLDADRMALIASNGSYVCNEMNGKAPLQANRAAVGGWETFEVVPPEGKRKAAPAPRSAKVQAKRALAIESGSSADVFTVCFAGTACTRDEGEVTRPESDKNIYCSETGYIPVRIHMEISGRLEATHPSVTVRGVGENDWSVPRNDSEPLVFDWPLDGIQMERDGLLHDVRKYSGGDQRSRVTQGSGYSAPALALHGANLAAASGAQQFNFVGHSRGAVEAIMAAWFLYAYGPDQVRYIPVNIFAIDPVPGPGEWYSMLTQLPPNVVNYVGIYAWDQCVQPADKPFSALVPRPNGLMMRIREYMEITRSWWPWNEWKYLADGSYDYYNRQGLDPLSPSPGNHTQPTGYELFACRGRHSTVAGNATANGKYDPRDVSEEVKSVPRLVYRMARAYLTQWGVAFPALSAVSKSAMMLRKDLNLNHRLFDIMGGGATRTSMLPNRPYVRRVSSIYGRNPYNTYFMDDVVGDPPYTMAYPVTKDRQHAGWVKWKFL